MKKVCVWDIDDTLAEGKFLETGTVHDLLPGRKDLCEELARRGVLQSVASHNRMEDVQTMLHAWDLDHIFLYPQGHLSESKADMMQRIMDSLQLARKEDLVLIDDDRGNIDEVRQAGFDAWNVVNLDVCVATCFTKDEYTEDDALRVQRYKDEERRERAATSYGTDRTAFLQSLGIELNISVPTEEEMPRVVDLVERSHRFSAMAQDYNAADLDTYRRTRTLFVGKVKDKFGDYGLSAVFLDIAGYMPLLAVSCRLAGKGVGSALVAWAINHNMGLLVASWLRTPYNESVEELFKWYNCIIERRESGWTIARHVEGLVTPPSWITLV